jgi:3-polyprenyl-4-hydroxybenzoate decarboxylase
VIAVDARARLGDPDDVFFHWCANCDPERDLHVRGHRIGFDATAKVEGDARNGAPVRDYPPPLVLSDEVLRKVKERWAEYGLGR